MDAELQAKIARAIGRSRDVRRALRSRRRRALALGACAAFLAGVPAAWSLAPLTDDGLVEAAVKKASSLVDLLDRRSPGQRTQAVLTKTRRAKALAGPMRSRARPEPGAAIPSPAQTLADVLVSAPSLVSVGAWQPVALLDVPPTPSMAGIIAPPSGGAAASPPGALKPPATEVPQTVPRSEPREPVSAVPEPATWTMMIFGLGLIGWRIRRGRSAAATQSA